MSTMQPLILPAGQVFVHLACGSTALFNSTDSFPAFCDVCGVADEAWSRVYVHPREEATR